MSQYRPSAAPMRVVLLGTGGGPRASRTRFPSSQAIVVGEYLIVIDCGNGVAKQLAGAGLSPRDMTHLLVTHHHVDHSADLGYLPMVSWVEGRTELIQVLGPPPTTGALNSILHGYAEDIEKRTQSTGRPDFRSLLQVRDIDRPGVVVDQDGLLIRAALVDHPPFDVALGYRVDASGASVVVSGDTAPSSALVDLAHGADVLIHEAVHPAAFRDLEKNTSATTIRDHMKRNHTMVEDVGLIAQRAGVGCVVLSHLIPHGGVDRQDWIRPVRRHFTGEVIVADDLLELRL